ncbi:MAG: hypothetical protein FJW39_04645 [Acidobacteria bacterium]|nr:hypothetical protein [Acidobacteriota bacterium]
MHDGVPWPQALNTTDIAAYPRTLREYLELHKTMRDRVLPKHKLYLVTNVIHHQKYDQIAPLWGAGPNEDLPADWDGTAFDSDRVKRASLNYLKALVEHFRPDYFTFAVEINILFSRRPDLWPRYSELHRFLYRGVREAFPTLPVCYSIHYENMLGLGTDARNVLRRLGETKPDPIINAVGSLLDSTDCIALSTYPFMVPELTINERYYDFARQIALFRNVPMFIEQTGHTSQPFDVFGVTVPGSTSAQEAFMARILFEALLFDFLFVINWVPRDYGLRHGDDIFSRTWAHTGLFDEAGAPKPALNVWEAFRALPLRPER